MKFVVVILILVSNCIVLESKVSNITFYISPFRLDDGVKELYRIIRPTIDVKDISLFNFSEGIANAMLKADDPTTRNPIVIRVFKGKSINTEKISEKSVKLDEQKLEISTFEKASEMNITARLIATFDNGLVMSFIEGDIIDMRKFDLKTAEEVARRVAKFHTIQLDDLTSKMPFLSKLVGKEWSSTVMNESAIRFFDEKMKDHSGLNHLPLMSELKTELEQLHKLLLEKNAYGEIGFCHNDLSLTNIIIETGTKIPYLIDFDMANTNYRNFEFAAFFVRLGGKFDHYWRFSDVPDDDFKKAFLRAYYLEYNKLTNVTMKEDEQFDKFLNKKLDNILATMLFVRLHLLEGHIIRGVSRPQYFDTEKLRNYTQSMYANYIEVKDQVLRNIGINTDELTSAAVYLRNSIAIHLICLGYFVINRLSVQRV